MFMSFTWNLQAQIGNLQLILPNKSKNEVYIKNKQTLYKKVDLQDIPLPFTF